MSSEPRPGEETEEVVSPFPSLLEWRQQRSPVPPAQSAPQEPAEPVAPAAPPSDTAVGRWRRRWRRNRQPEVSTPPDIDTVPLKPVRRSRLARQVTVVGEPIGTAEPTPPTPPVADPPDWEAGEVLVVDSTVLPQDPDSPHPAPPVDEASDSPPHHTVPVQAAEEPGSPRYPAAPVVEAEPVASPPDAEPAAPAAHRSAEPGPADPPPPWPVPRLTPAPLAPPPPPEPGNLPSPVYGLVAEPAGSAPAQPPPPPIEVPVADSPRPKGSGPSISSIRDGGRLSSVVKTITAPGFITVVAGVVAVAAGIGLFVVLRGGQPGESVDPATLPSPVATYTQQPAPDNGPVPPEGDAALEPPVDGWYQFVVFGNTGCIGQEQVPGPRVELTVVDCEASHSTWNLEAGRREQFEVSATDGVDDSFGDCLAPVELGAGNGFRDVACDGDDRELYYFDPVAAGVYRIRSAVSQYCMSVSSGRIVQSACRADKATQEFRIRQMTR